MLQREEHVVLLRGRLVVDPVGGDVAQADGARLVAADGDDERDGPVVLCDDPSTSRERMAAAQVRDLMLELAGLPEPQSAETQKQEL